MKILSKKVATCFFFISFVILALDVIPENSDLPQSIPYLQCRREGRNSVEFVRSGFIVRGFFYNYDDTFDSRKIMQILSLASSSNWRAKHMECMKNCASYVVFYLQLHGSSHIFWGRTKSAWDVRRSIGETQWTKSYNMESHSRSAKCRVGLECKKKREL